MSRYLHGLVREFLACLEVAKLSQTVALGGKNARTSGDFTAQTTEAHPAANSRLPLDGKFGPSAYASGLEGPAQCFVVEEKIQFPCSFSQSGSLAL